MSALRQICSQIQRAVSLGSVRQKAPRSSINNIFFARPFSSAGHQPSITRSNYDRSPSPGVRNLSSSPDNKKKALSPLGEDFSKMTNEELQDTGTIPGWDLIHSPPGKMPRGALVGTVVSTKMQKTINVSVDRYRIVPKIRKRVKYTRKFFAHDETGVANLGDLVMITPCHRISKHKHFLLRKIVRPKGQL
jgi:small subunit ribosomal protein S17